MNRQQVEYEKERIRLWFDERDRRKASEPISIPPRKKRQVITITVEDDDTEPSKCEEKKSD